MPDAVVAPMQARHFALHADVEERHWWFLGRRRIMHALIRQMLPPAQGRTVVDVGCGTGANVAVLAGEYACIGVDDAAEAIRLARARFPHIQFLCGSVLQDASAAVRAADGLLLMDVLEHVPDDVHFFSALVALLRPGAQLLLTVPADPALWSAHDVSFGHYRRYDAERLRRVWEGLPVTPQLVCHYNARLYPLVAAARALSRWRGQPLGDAGTDLRVPPSPINRLLTWCFAGESATLLNALQDRRAHGYTRGVSLLAVLRRDAREVVPRPAAVLADERYRSRT